VFTTSTASVFSAVEAVSGIGSLQHTSSGIALQATASTVQFVYSTHYCHDFFSSRGRLQQLCNDPIAAVKASLSGGPNALLC